jgi:hypothetical protein
VFRGDATTGSSLFVTGGVAGGHVGDSFRSRQLDVIRVGSSMGFPAPPLPGCCRAGWLWKGNFLVVQEAAHVLMAGSAVFFRVVPGSSTNSLFLQPLE